MSPVAQRLGVQGAAAPAREAGVVEEDARAVVDPGGGAAGGRAAVDRVDLGPVLEAAPVVLPGLRGEPRDRRADPGLVVGVGEERAVRAAALVGAAGDDAVAGLAEDAGPAGQQP